MFSAYGPNELDAEILLGWAMQILHEQPVLTRDIVQSSLTAAQGGAGRHQRDAGDRPVHAGRSGRSW